MDQEAKALVKSIIKGIQEKKGKNIVTIDLTELPGVICKYMVICEGNTPNQLSSLYDSVSEEVRKDIGEKPISTVGVRNAQWIGLDYGTVLVHLFLPDLRDYYNLEHLWEDSKIERIPDLD